MPCTFDPKGGRQPVTLALFLCLGTLIYALHLKAGDTLWATEHNAPLEIQLDLIDPVLDRQSISTSKGGIVRGKELHVEAHELIFTRDAQAKKSGRLFARGGVYLQYFGKRFVGQELEYDVSTRTGILRQGRTKLGQWFVGSCEVQLSPDGSCQLRLPYATTSLRVPSRWQVHIDDLLLTDTRELDVTGLKVLVGQKRVARMGSFKINARTIQNWPLLLTGAWGSKSQRRLGVRYKLSGDQWRANLEIDRWWTRGWGFGGHIKGRGMERHWSLAHYALHESAPRSHWRFCSSATMRQNFPRENAYLEGKIFHASDANFISERLANSTIYKPTPKSHLSYHQAHEQFVLNAQAVVKINRFETVKQLLPQCAIRARPLHLPGGFTFDQGIDIAHLKMSFAEKEAQNDFATWRGLWTGSVYRGFDLGHNITATGGLSARIYTVSNTPFGDSIGWVTPRWDGHLQTTWVFLHGHLIHRITPYLHHQVSRSNADQCARCYVFDLEEAPTAAQKLEWGARGALSTERRALLDYELSFRDPIGPLSKYSAHLAQLSLNWHVSNRCDLGLRTTVDRRRKRIERTSVSARATLSPSLAAILEYDRRSPYSWRGIGEDRNWLQQLHSIEDLLHSSLSDRRQTLGAQLYWRLEPDWVFRAHSRWGFGRDRHSVNRYTSPYWEYGISAATSLSATWKVQLHFGQRKGGTRFSCEISASTKTPTIVKHHYD